MASRTSTGVAMAVTLTIFIVLTVALFVTTMVFLSGKQRAERELVAFNDNNREIINEAERGAERVRSAVRLAQQENESLVASLLNGNRRLARLVAGNENLTPAEVTERAEAQASLSGASLLDRVDRFKRQIADLERQLEEERGRFRAASQDASSELNRFRGAIADNSQAISGATGEIGEYRNQVQGFRDELEAFTESEVKERDQIRSSAQTTQRQLEDRLAALNAEVLTLRDQLRRARGEGASDALRPIDEYALVDGEVAGINPLDNTVDISLGRGDKIVVGMTFGVYSQAGDLRPDIDTGEYQPGKADIEVISISEDSATCRIVRSSLGNPVVRGDVIANPVFDPNKTYVFVVQGDFDVNGDGVPTPQERDDLAGLIERWGGTVVPDIRGDVDFLVLGSPPVQPPVPPAGAPIQVVNEFVRLKQANSTYTELFNKARDSSIPVLNANRLRTLLGALPL